jgi:fibronectin type 3 domain-containing protein
MRTKDRHSARATLLCLVAIVALGLTTVTGARDAQAGAQPNCTPDAKLVNPCRPWFGAWSNYYPGVSGWKAHMLAEEARIGRPLDIVHNYHPPGGAPPLTAEEKFFVNRPGTILYANWKPVTSWADAGGGNAAVNAQIDQAADSIKSVAPAKIMLTIYHEPEPLVTPGTSPCSGLKGSSGSPADYRAMWRNIEQRFAARGVTNVVWVMNYMGFQEWDCLVPGLWPGNDLVDWVMFDPYDTSQSSSWSSSVSRFYNYLAAKSDASHDYLGKPWGLAEFGVGRNTDQPHAYAFYDAALASVERNDFPRLKAYVVFDSEGIFGTRTSYSVAGVFDPIEQQRFNTLANSPVFRNPVPPPPDLTPPTVTLVEPSAADSVQGDVTVQAATSDDVAVTGVTYAVDGGPDTDMPLGPSGTATATWDSTAVPDGPHDLVVRASDAAGNASTATASITAANADVTPPTTPTDLRTRSTTTDTVNLVWDAATDDRGVTGYRITRDGQEIWSGAGTSYADPSVQPGTTYLYQVAALDAAGNASPDTDALQVLVPESADTSPPSTPELSAQRSGDDVQLSWTAADDDRGVFAYEIFRDGNLIKRVDGGTNAHTDSNLRQGQSFDYTVKAVDAAGNAGELSTARSVDIPDTTAPDAPSQLTGVEDVTLGAVSVSWTTPTDNVGVTGYHVSRDGAIIASTSTPGYLDTTVEQGKAYDYTITAFDAGANVSAPSAPLRVTTADRTAPIAPAKPAASLAGSAVTLTWPATTDNVGVTGYRVRRDGANVASVAGTSYTDSAAPQGSTHAYSIVAFDAANNSSAASASLSIAVPDTTRPATPAKPTVALASGRATLTWNAVSDNVGVVKYGVKRDGVLLATPTGRSYVDATVKQGRTYSYAVTAYDAANNVSAGSPATSLVVPDTVAPATPANFKGVAGAKKVTLSWTASTDNVAVTGYEIWRGTTRLGTTTGLTFTNTGLTTGSSYNYKVRAYDAKGNFSPYTAVITVRAR